MDDSFSPYNLMSSSESPTSTLVSPESWTQGKSPNEKMSSNSNINWPPGKLQWHIIHTDHGNIFFYYVYEMAQWLTRIKLKMELHDQKVADPCYILWVLMLDNQLCSCFFSEFCPGVPWKGLQNIDPENDPNMTPGSVPSGPTINTNIQDVNRYLLRDRTGGKDDWWHMK